MEREAMNHYVKSTDDRMVIDVFSKCENITDLFNMESQMKNVMSGMKLREYEKEDADKMYIRLSLGSDDDGI
jgi:hypothetical protein